MTEYKFEDVVQRAQAIVTRDGFKDADIVTGLGGATPLFKDVSISDTHWKCQVCLCLPRNPVSLTRCGHVFCEHCILHVHKTQNAERMNKIWATCPICRVDFSRDQLLKVDNWPILVRSMWKLIRVKCAAPGCDFVSGPATVIAHEDKACDYRDVPFIVLAERYADAPKRDGRQLLMGFDDELVVKGFDKVKNYPVTRAFWRCIVCKRVPRVPVSLAVCGHICCAHCARTALVTETDKTLCHGHAHCAGCRIPFKAVDLIDFSNWPLLMKQLWKTIDIKCTNDGCTFHSDPPDVHTHQRFSCEFREVVCVGEGCGYKGTVKNLVVHIQNCDRVYVHCLKCKFPIQYTRRLLHDCVTLLSSHIRDLRDALYSDDVPAAVYMTGAPGEVALGDMQMTAAEMDMMDVSDDDAEPEADGLWTDVTESVFAAGGLVPPFAGTSAAAAAARTDPVAQPEAAPAVQPVVAPSGVAESPPRVRPLEQATTSARVLTPTLNGSFGARLRSVIGPFSLFLANAPGTQASTSTGTPQQVLPAAQFVTPPPPQDDNVTLSTLAALARAPSRTRSQTRRNIFDH